MLLALLVVLAGVPVSGRVIDAESHNPIAGVRVMLMPERRMVPPGAEGPLQTVTDINGRFVFEVTVDNADVSGLKIVLTTKK